MAPNDTRPVPREDVLRAITAYKHARETETLHGALTKRRAVRALTRLKGACNEVLKAIEALPDELQTLYSGPLRAAAAEIAHEAGWRRSQLLVGRGKIRTGVRRHEARASLENRIARLFEQYGGRLTTYDPRRYVEPRGGQGKRGGRLAQLLLTVYRLAGITPPVDLTPTLSRLAHAAKARAKWEAERKVRASARGRDPDPLRFLRVS